MAEDLNIVYGVNDTGTSFSMSPTSGDYDPGNLVEIDRAIRHMPAVVDYLQKKAGECRGMIEHAEHFRVIMSTGGQSRARAYVAPSDNAGIHLELADSVMLKAAASMSGR